MTDIDLSTVNPSDIQTDVPSGSIDLSKVNPDDIQTESDVYDTAGQKLKTVAEHAASSATFGLSTAAEVGLGIAKPEDIQARTRKLPGYSTIGDIAGLLTPGAPEAELLGAAGKAGANALGLGVKGAGWLSKISAGAVKSGIENAMFQAGDEASKKFTQDPDQTAQTAISHITLSGLLGLGIGGAAHGVFGTIPELWDGSKADKFVTDMKNRFTEHLTNPGLSTEEDLEKQAADLHDAKVKAAEDEHAGMKAQTVSDLSDRYTDTAKGSNDLYNGSYAPDGTRLPNVKDQAMAKLVPQLNDKILDHVGEVMNTVSNKLDEMKADPDTYQPKFTKSLEKDLGKCRQVVDDPNAESEDKFFAIEDLKRTLQNRSRVGIPIDNSNPAFDSINALKELSVKLRKSLENEEVWGAAGQFQKDTNSAFSKFQKPLKDFNQSFTGKVNGVNTPDVDKIGTALNAFEKGKGDIRGQRLENYLDAEDQYREAINKAHEIIGAPAPFTLTPENPIKSAINSVSQGAKKVEDVIAKKLSPGAKAADSMVKAALSKSYSNLAGAAGYTIAGWPGAMVGKYGAGPILDHLMPNLIKPILGSAADGTALKHAMDYVSAVSKGAANLSSGIKNVFTAGKEAIPATAIPTDKERSKLSDTLSELGKDPSKMIDIGGKVSSLLPDHGQSLSKTAMAAVNYLNSQRPGTTQAAPMDKPIPPDPMAKNLWNRTLNIAENPLSILNHIKSGTLQPVDIKTLQNLYPSLYTSMATEMLNQVSKFSDKPSQIPYHIRASLSLFAQQPLDSTMSQTSILAAQPMPVQAQQAPEGKQKKPTAASAKAMETVAQNAMTPQQARSAEKSRVST